MPGKISKSPNIKIIESITEKDFLDAIKLIKRNLYSEDTIEGEFRSTSSGELLLAKDRGKIVGVLYQRRPGKIFVDYPDEYFELSKIKAAQKSIGYIAVIAVAKDCQGLGIGKMLLKKALGLQQEFGSGAVVVHCSKNSPGNASEKLFTSFGFKPLKLFVRPWEEISKIRGKEGFACAFCGNPCVCDELEMVKYL